VLSSRRVTPGREADSQAWARGIVAAARQFPGHLGAWVLDAPGSREDHILFSFADRTSLRVWLESAERPRWLAGGGELPETDRGLVAADRPGDLVQAARRQGGDDAPPPRWKLWLVSLVAVYPLVLEFQALLCPGWPGCRSRSQRCCSRWCC
jgi:antibiotic biosynthesis monooxygenase (ABM) superfamily enzyme